MKRIRTVGDVRDAKRLADARAEARAAKRQGKTMQQACTEALVDNRIGVLCRKGKPLFYAYVRGVYAEHTDAKALAAELAK